MAIDLLFRFRDLVAQTIPAHRKVIEDLDWCWWGWWKRPSEDSRADVWTHIQTRLTEAGPYYVGLFDSGRDAVYTAKVIGVIPPEDSDSLLSAERTVPIPENEKEHVPLYYRDSPFSRAWLKLSEIQQRPISFFGNYSFAESPKLPSYAPITLARFKNKKIVSGAELRGMDTTIWRIRSAEPGDHSEQIILSINAVGESISFQIIESKYDRILRLTDLHFAASSNRAQHVWGYVGEQEGTLVHAVTNALGDKKIGILIISGDFTFIGSSNEFDFALAALARLMGVLDIGADQVVIVPGNHDIQWSTDKTYKHDAPVKRAPVEVRKNYEEFYRKLLRHEPSETLSMGRRYALPCGVILEICGLNSSSLETGKKFLAGMGRIDEGGFGTAARILNWRGKSTAALRILVIHHHLALTDDLESANEYGRGFGIAVDAVRIQRLAARNGVQLVLHGHKHRSFLWRSTVFELPEHAQTEYRLGELSIVGGGSAGSSDTESHSNYFNVISVKPSKLALEIYRTQNAGTFTPISTWEADISVSPSGLRLGDWQKVQ